MKRRHFISNSAVGVTSAIALNACSQPQTVSTSDTLPTLKWNMATSWPESLDTIYGGAKIVCDRVKQLTGGKFTIEPYPAGALVPALGILDAVQQGTVECGHTASYYYIGKNPALGFGTAMPFGLTAQQQNAWFYHGGGLETMHKLYSDFNVINFPAGNTGVQMGGWFKQEIQGLSDLKGLKMRIPGTGGEVMSRLGVNVQVLPGGDTFFALNTGAIDAAEWVGPYDDEKLGFNKIAQYYYYPGWWEPGATLEVQINKTQWERLPESYQAALQTAAMEANLNMLAQYDALNQDVLQRLIEGGTQLTPYPTDVLEAAKKVSFELLEENASKDGTFKEVYESWKQFRQQIYQWHSINELSFASFSFENP
ncbi:MAG: TRAP transporter substrate-binding protein [Microcystaceae cyanobacterium]